MGRFIYSLLLIGIVASCTQGGSRQKEIVANEKKDSGQMKEVRGANDTGLINTDTGAVSPKLVTPDSLQANFTVFTDFYENFRKVVDTKNWKEAAGFVNFPFEEQGGLFTEEQFVRVFELEKDNVNFIRRRMPKRINAEEYRLLTEDAGLIFKKNNKGYWKWFSIHYAE